VKSGYATAGYAALAEKERALISERTKAALAAAKELRLCGPAAELTEADNPKYRTNWREG
jgi:hypothetical protein